MKIIINISQNVSLIKTNAIDTITSDGDGECLP